MTSPDQPFLSRYTPDNLFFFAFSINIGLLPPFITLLGSKALQLPLIIIAVLIYARLLLRPKVLTRFIKSLNNASTLLILAFIGLMLIHALNAEYADSDQIRLLLKPGVVLLAMTALHYSISNQCELEHLHISKTLLIGMLIGLLIISSLSIWSGSEWVGYLDSHYGFVKTAKLNRALEVSSVLVFLCAVGITDRRKSFALTIAMTFWVYLMSFLVVGSAFWSGTWHPQIHVDSETLQFGMPLAFIVFLLAHWFPDQIKNLVFGGIVTTLLSAPWLYQGINKILQSSIDPSMPIGIRKILLRGEIWDLVARKALEAPITGHGIDSARYLGNIVVTSATKQEVVLVHPHNMILQLWLDLGFAGVAIVTALLVIAWRSMKYIPASNLPAVLGGITMLTAFSIVSHSLWQTWSISLIAIFITLVSMLLRGKVRLKPAQPANNIDN